MVQTKPTSMCSNIANKMWILQLTLYTVLGDYNDFGLFLYEIDPF